MATTALFTTDTPSRGHSSAVAEEKLWTEMLETILNHFRDGREARILLPVHGQQSIAVDGSVRTSSEDTLGIALPFDRDFSVLINPREICQILFSLHGREYRLLTRIQHVFGPSDLLVIPKPPAIALQEREFFRIDAKIRLDYFSLEPLPAFPPRALHAKVNLSASGILLPDMGDLAVGESLAMVLWLDGKHPETIECLAQVVRFTKLPNGSMAVALCFAEIDNQDRDKIVAFCLAKEREILRTKVRTRDLF